MSFTQYTQNIKCDFVLFDIDPDPALCSLFDTNAANSDTQLTKSSSLHKNLKRSAKISAWRFGFSSFVAQFGCCEREPEMKPIA